jgi:hypothetical protein
MLGAYFAGIPQACRAAEAVVLADVLGLAACWPYFVAWSATSELALSTLLKCWWWRWVVGVVIVVLIGTMVASVGHLIIVKRFEIELKIEI